jgi:hypothetical protein
MLHSPLYPLTEEDNDSEPSRLSDNGYREILYPFLVATHCHTLRFQRLGGSCICTSQPCPHARQWCNPCTVRAVLAALDSR